MGGDISDRCPRGRREGWRKESLEFLRKYTGDGSDGVEVTCEKFFRTARMREDGRLNLSVFLSGGALHPERLSCAVIGV